MWPSIAPSKARAVGTLAASAAALAGYALLSHWLMVNAAAKPWAVAVLFGPLVLALAGAAWQRRQGLLLAACAAGVALLVAVVARGGVRDVQLMYVLQHAGIHLALAAGFGLSLRGDAQPLITAMASTLHQKLTPALRAYTRRLTAVWTAYFLGMVVLSLLIYGFAPWPAWSLFCNLFTPLAAVGLFVGEHALRYHWHPEFERVSLRAAFNAYRGGAAR